MRRLALCGSLLIAGACFASEVHQIDGANSKFCLPEANRVADVQWVPADKPGAPESFAFAGCGAVSGSNSAKCDTPKLVLSGVVEAKAAFHSQKWSDFSIKSMLKQITLSPDADMKSFNNGDIIVVHNEKLWHRDWYIWGKAKRLSNKSVPHLEDNDLLLATCHNQNSSVPYVQSKRAAIVCDRSILAGDYALQYTFQSDERVPQNLQSLDSAVIVTINHWRCKDAL